MEDYSMLSHTDLGTHMYDVSIASSVILLCVTMI